MKLCEIAEAVGGELHGNGLVEIGGVASLEDAEGGHISFLAEKKNLEKISSSRASAFVVPSGIDYKDKSLLISDNPTLTFAKVVKLFCPQLEAEGIDKRALLEDSVNAGKDVSIQANVYVGEGTVLGDRVRLYPGVYIGKGCRVGNDTILYPNVVVMDSTEIGERAIVHGGTVIGSDGYGYIWDGKSHQKVPQVGKVVIGDDVEIGANCAIDRATLSKTEIRNGAKIDNLVHIAHNCIIGENTLLAGQVGFAGSVTVGRNVMMAGQVGVADHVSIGNNVMIGGRSGVTNNIEDGAKITGYPPLPHREWLRVQKSLEKLPEMRKLLKELSNKVEKMEAQDA